MRGWPKHGHTGPEKQNGAHAERLKHGSGDHSLGPGEAERQRDYVDLSGWTMVLAVENV